MTECSNLLAKMTFRQQEAIACLQLLACLAKADGKLHSEEKKILTQAWQKVQALVTLPEELTLDTILAEDIQIDKVLPQIVNIKTQINYRYGFGTSVVLV